MSVGEAVEARPARRSLRPFRWIATLVAVLALLFGVPWWTLVASGALAGTGVYVAGTVLFGGALVGVPGR